MSSNTNRNTDRNDSINDVDVKVTIFQESAFSNYGDNSDLFAGTPSVYTFVAKFSLDVNSDYAWPGTNKMLERIFESGNVGALSERLAYSMSVGDLVSLGTPEDPSILGTWRCENFGWNLVSIPR